MLELLKAIKHCYLSPNTCKDCPYENNTKKCSEMFNNIEMIFTKIGEHIDLEDIQNIVKIILKKEDTNSENED